MTDLAGLRAATWARVTTPEKNISLSRSLSFERRQKFINGTLRLDETPAATDSSSSVDSTEQISALPDPYETYDLDSRPMTAAQKAKQIELGGSPTIRRLTSRAGSGLPAPTPLATSQHVLDRDHLFQPQVPAHWNRPHGIVHKRDSPPASPPPIRVVSKGLGDRSSHIDCLPLSQSYERAATPSPTQSRWEYHVATKA